VGKLISYSVCGTECYFEFCLFEKVGNVGSFLAYIGETGPLLRGCSGCCWSCWVLGGGV
jgi:hypothetical protein